MKTAALILAGGKGERFWPGSRSAHPKQFLSLTGDGISMIAHTVERILPLVAMEDIFISTNESYRSLVEEQLPGIKKENIICEPVARNTAPGIGLGAVHMRKAYKDAMMLVLPSDHQIGKPEEYIKCLSAAMETAEISEGLVTMGITPSFPETGYGYIRADVGEKCADAFKVERFVEKPDLETAKKYLEEGGYLWNSGQFIWKVSAILSAMEKAVPSVYSGLEKIESAIGTPDYENILLQEFEKMESVSVDNGVMEKEKKIFVLPGDFGWDDVGSWLALERLNKPDADGNIVQGNAELSGVSSSIIRADKKLIAVVGLEDVVVVDTEDATLICSKEKTGDIKKLLAALKAKGREEYL